MRGKLMFLGGLAAGFVLGSRAGRQAYDELVQTAKKVKESPTVQEAAGVVQAQATKVYEQSKATVTDKLSNTRFGDKLLHTEPETILPSLTVDAGAILDFAIDHEVSQLRSEVYGTDPITAEQGRHLRTVVELHTRLTLSFIVTPHTSINLATMDDTRSYVRNYLLPMITDFR